ncbi:MAG: hypothetical protein ACE5MM_10985 [Nitrospiraceae bacterium]
MRRLLIPGPVLLALTILVSACASQSDLVGARDQVALLQAQVANAEEEVATLRARVSELSRPWASGGGVNVKMMPDPITRKPTSPMDEVFSFDLNHAICRVDTNPTAFVMPTHEMGELVIEPNQFFMSMVATIVESYEVSTLADGKRQVILEGGLDCATEIAQAGVTIGSRTAAEHAAFKITAVDGGFGGAKVGDSFAFTVFFDKHEAPVNYAIFGPEFTFTGEMVVGEITIKDPASNP